MSKGSAKVLATKKDYYNELEAYPDNAKEKLKILMDGRFIWQENGHVADIASGVTDDDNKVVNSVDENGAEIFIQMTLIEDSNSEFFRMGWTIEEANAFLAV